MHRTVNREPVPYPLPEKWQLTAARPTRWWWVVLWCAVGGAAAAFALFGLVQGDPVRGFVGTLCFGVIGTVLGVTYIRYGGERGMPQLLNAVVLTRALVRPPDSWVHFFREAGPGHWLTVSFTSVGLCASAGFAWVATLVIRDGGDAVGTLFVTVPLFLAFLIIAAAGIAATILQWRHASFGRRQSGLSIGRDGVIHYNLDTVQVWPWESIAQVRAVAEGVVPEAGDFIPKVAIARRDGAEEIELHLGGHHAHAWLIYSALRFWHEHPEARRELSTSAAQRRMRNWHHAMHPAKSSTVDVGASS